VNDTTVTTRILRAARLFVLTFALPELFAASAASAATLTATIQTPANGATNADLTIPIQWAAVPNADAYYLYVGRTLGGKDLVNTGEIQRTSQTASDLPLNTLLYARLWTKVAGVWRSTDSTFAAAYGAALIANPTNASTNADLTLPISWNTLSGAQSYYLYVGTSAGAKDLINTGEITQTSYATTGVPENQTVFARLWTKSSGVWRFTDSTFRGARLVSRITAPSDGSTNFDWAMPIQWNALPNAQAYYLYIGSTPGARDLFDSGETQLTSARAINLPANQTVYARLWTKVANVWHYTDSSFSGALATAAITFPLNGAVNVDLSKPVQWTTVPNVQSYYLWVGTSPGLQDVANFGETSQTSYVLQNAPSGQTLYARIWTKVGGAWHYADSSFSGAAATSSLTYPANGAVDADLSVPINWTAVANAQAYYLYVGTTPGAKDVINTGEIPTTSYQARAGWPVHQTLYARVWVKTASVWHYTDSSFSAQPPVSTLTYPPNGGLSLDKSRPAAWAAVPGVTKYYLYIGTQPGQSDLVNSGETTATSWPLEALPDGAMLYARLWTKVTSTTWRYVDSQFSLGPLAPQFVYPYNGATSVDATLPFSWVPATSADRHWLYIGTRPGGSDVADSGELAVPTYSPASLPDRRTLYARVWSRVNNGWTRYTDIAFSPRPLTSGATMFAPRDLTTDFDASQPFRWSPVALAQAYRLRIGLSRGGNDLHDSGEIRVTRRLVPGLPIGVQLFGQLLTKIDGQWVTSEFTFTVGVADPTPATRIDAALWATKFVRAMADANNRPYAWSPLSDFIAPRYSALCSDYAELLLQILEQVNVGLQSRRMDVTFNGTSLDAHTLAEVVDPATGQWMILDPTFALAARRADGSWASASDISQATLASRWTDISYVFVSTALDAYARAYYIDYPVLFVNVQPKGESVPTPNPYITPYLNAVNMPVNASRRGYVIRCIDSTSAQVVVDGAPVSLACNAVGNFSGVFYASTVAAPTSPAAFELFELLRFVF